MKTIYLLITCILIQWGAFAQEGVNFRNLTFNEALAQAKAEKKWYSWTATHPGAGHAKK